MVQLKWNIIAYDQLNILCFNSCMVQLKSTSVEYVRNLFELF